MLLSLAAARVNAGMTQREVAQKLKISVATLQYYERDSTNISKKLFDKITSLYQVDQDLIFVGKKSDFCLKSRNNS